MRSERAPCQTASVDLGEGRNASAPSQWEPRILDSVFSPGFLQRRRALRWLAPLGVVCVAGLAATGVFKASASSESLPQTTPAALLAAVQTSGVDGFSGTVVSRLSLGLPELPELRETDDATSFTSLLAGSHTLQVWYGGVDKQRVALLGATDETDIFRNGADVWQWSSADQVAVHARVPVQPSRTATSSPSLSVSSLTPVDLARDAIRSMDSSTQVKVDEGHTVADRSAYELVLSPRAQTTKVGSVHIAVDGATKIPLGVQVFARDSASPAIDMAFTSIRFARQADRNFVFSPPSSANVRELASPPATVSSGLRPAAAVAAPVARRIGSGWTSVVALRPGKADLAKFTAGGMLKALAQVSGPWGKGRLLESPLLSLLITDDGQVFAGAVAPSHLYAAAGTK
jgi:outer membrane lipoprotein-sorting protein